MSAPETPDCDSEPQIRSTHVEKQLELEFDLGNLLASDPNEINVKSLKSNPSAFLKQLARDNTQLLLNQVWTLPFERVDDVVVAKLPAPTYILPREKPVPKAKGLTKWEQYAKDKGIRKKTKTKLVWDEIVNAWVPRFGYKRAAAQHEKDWVLEVPQNADPYEDQFAKQTEAKSERVAKNELQRLKNIARSRKVAIPTAGLVPTERPSKKELHQAMHVAKKATASLGKFQEKLPGKVKPLKSTGRKRQFEPLVQASGTEKTKNLEVLEQVMNKKPKISMEKAVNQKLRIGENVGGGGGSDDEDGGRKGSKFRKSRGGDGGGQERHKNTKQKRGSAGKGSFKKGRSSPRSKPKRKKH